MIAQLQRFQSSILKSYGATATEIEELLIYNQNVFDHSNWQSSLEFPLESETHVACWSEYLQTAREIGIWATLKSIFVQLRFPIAEGISQTEAYRAAIFRGVEPDTIPEATGLRLKQPEKISLQIYPSFAGAIPVILPGNREDFVTLVQAITKRNEPKPIPPSMGACMIAGYNNWQRIRQCCYERTSKLNSGTPTPRPPWLQKTLDSREIAWQEAFKRLIPQKNLYQDRFIILSDGFYSNVAPEALGLTKLEWRQLSLTIRLEHECTHYFTRRLFNSMQNNLLDELIADYRGIVAAIGYYRADWFLHFMGLESFPELREDGRLQNYRGKPPLSDRAFKILQALVVAAAKNLEYCDRALAEELKLSANQPLMSIALTYMTLEELASEQAVVRLQKIFRQLQNTTTLPNI